MRKILAIENMLEKNNEFCFPDPIKNKITSFINYVKTSGNASNLLFVGCPAKYIPNTVNIVANKMGVNIKELDGMGAKPGDLAKDLTNLNEGDVFYFRNISSSSSETMRVFEQALRDYTLTITIGTGHSARTVNLPIPKFCAVLFVDNINQVPSTILEEFYQVVDFSNFKQELRIMDISDFATKYSLSFTQTAKEKILKQCANDEQIKLKLIEIRTRAFEAGITTITEDFLQENFDSVPELERINTMDGREFELFTGKLFKALGYTNVTVTQSSCDFGADVIAEKDDVRFAIQCKRYSVPVGISAVQEVIASKSLHDCHVACILTNNTFTPAAKELARKNLVILWDGIKLKDFILRTT